MESNLTSKVDAAFRNRALQIGVDLPRVKTHCGLRPMVADDGMTIGRVGSFKNLSLLVGPGFNRWKLGFGAAALLAQSLEGNTPEFIDQSMMDAF